MHVRNEEAAAFAASAEAQLTGRLAVCAGSCGPGNTHLIQGVMDAHRSGAPVLALASHIPSRQIGTGYFQETKPEALFAQASHFCETVAHPSQVQRLTRVAVQAAVGRRGAAMLVLPGDVLADRGTRRVHQRDRHRARADRRPTAGAGAASWPAGSPPRGKVAIFAGIGCADARDERPRARRPAARPRSGTRCAARTSCSTTTPSTSG